MNTFSKRVVACALAIPYGRVSTYGRIARASGGGVMASQSVTSILAKAYNEGEKNIPFHRIVYANGTVWLNEKYKKERMKRYKEEGIEVDKNGTIKNFEKILFEFR
ncbi:MAG: Cysteine methyltransferase [Patescibacteria group bacterium]|nr:Cysteine methyltransferase [Patescibacteria group bacterium]